MRHTYNALLIVCYFYCSLLRIKLLFLIYTSIGVTKLKQLKAYTITGTLFVLILGSLSHFSFEWSNNKFIVGLFAPVSESVWEHMKLIFFPMLLYFFSAIPKLQSTHPCILSAAPSGILLGTLLIPVIFYTYTGILGQNFLILDISTFVLSAIAAFYTVYRLALSCRMQNYTLLLWVAVCLFAICFIAFTYSPPDIGLFTDPTAISR